MIGNLPLIFIKTIVQKEMWIYICGLLCTILNGVFGIEYQMEEYCNNEISFIWKSIHQSRLVLNDYHIYDKRSSYYPYERFGYCETTLEAWLSRYTKFMFYFQLLDLDCNDGHLEFYIDKTTSTRVTGLNYDVCGHKPQGVFTVDSRYFRIKYVSKKPRYISNIFAIIITSFGEGLCLNYGHECDNGRCIDEDIACSGYDSCGDGSGCDLSTGTIVGIVIGSTVGVCVIICAIFCCICCRKVSKDTTGTVQSTATTGQAVTTFHPMTGLPMSATSQRSTYSTNMTTYPVAAPINEGIQYFNQQSDMLHNYGFNQGTNHRQNETPNAPPETRGLLTPSAPPPSYDEIMSYSDKT